MKWISVKDRLPSREIESVLCYRGYVSMLSVDWYFYQNDCQKLGVTHWMPLPKPPEEL